MQSQNRQQRLPGSSLFLERIQATKNNSLGHGRFVLPDEMSPFDTEMMRSFGPHSVGKQFKISILFVDT